MHIKIDMDITAEEMRRLMGLPDLEPFQQELLDDIRQRIKAGVDGYDPMQLFEPYFKGGLAGMDVMQRMFSAGMRGATSKMHDDEG